MSRFVALSHVLRLPRLASLTLRKCSTKGVSRESVFFDPSVQTLLLKLQGRDHGKVFRTRKLGVNPDKPSYQFMTQQELEEAQEEVELKMTRKLNMPPVMEARKDTSQVLEVDPLLQGFDTSKYVFTDITFGVPDRQRIVVVRDTCGSLRTSTWQEHDRINNVYYPREGRRHYEPALFEPANLEAILGPDKYEYVLDSNCLQYEPDHPAHVRTLGLVHSHISARGEFDCLQSTRHFGPMVFSLCWTRQQDELLVHLVVRDRLEEAVETVAVYLRLHPDCALNNTKDLPGLTDQELLRRFCKVEAVKSGKISMALNRLMEEKEQKEQLLSSHGAKL